MMYVSTAVQLGLWSLIGALFVVESFSPVLRTPSQQQLLSPSLAINRVSPPTPLAFYSTSSSRLWKRRSDGWDDDEDDEDEEDEDDIDLLSDRDWRDFRAKLVMGENQEASSSPTSSSSSSSTTKEGSGTGGSNTTSSSSSETILQDDGDLDGIGSIFSSSSSSSSASSMSTAPVRGSFGSDNNLTAQMTPLDPSQWAYDSGKIIEQGAVILGGVEQDFGFGLRQQYFHKAAILVLDHEETHFTKGIILNRPSDLTLEDDINEGVRWRVWFGGDVQGLNSDRPDIVCLHSLKNEQAIQASIKVMKDIQWTTFENAKRLVQNGAAEPTDFWVFMGYAGWGPGQLMGELDRKSWYMVATDSQTLLKELARQSAASDPREAGLDTWTLLMNMIGRTEVAKDHSGDFDDLMLKEWALKHLLSSEAGGGAGERNLSADVAEGSDLSILQEPLRRMADPLDRLMSRMKGGPPPPPDEEVVEGSVIRASPAERSPFLLDCQEFHKSIVLVLSDDRESGISIGAILNRPASKGIDIQIKDKSSQTKKVRIPLRFGGQYTVQGVDPLLWLHCNPVLRENDIGTPVGPNEDGIWKCTPDDVISSISRNLAVPEDFIVISGVSIWSPNGPQRDNMHMEIDQGKFEVVPDSKIESVWKVLSKQDVLSSDNLSLNLDVATEAWNAGSHKNVMNGAKNGKSKKEKSGKAANGKREFNPIKGLGDGFDEEDDSLVFKSDVKVAKLSDEALRSWIATFLLGVPSLESDEIE